MTNQIPAGASLEQLKTRLNSEDREISDKAFVDAARLGKAATPILLEALTNPDPRTRRLAAEGLSEIGDPSSADALFKATKDSSGEVRSRAAAALYQLHDGRALPALSETINDYPDILHNPYTASMFPLMQGGKEVLPYMIPLLRSPDDLTRQRAFLVLKAVASRVIAGKNWEEFWRSLGSYDPLALEAEREHAVDLWEAWAAKL
jgi:HEAT repeat protein